MIPGSVTETVRFTCLLLLLCGTTACPSTAAPAEAPPPEATNAAHAAPPSVAAVPAGEASWLQVPARTLIAPDSVAVISPPLPARVTKIRVRPGDHVEPGAAVVELVMPELIRAAGEMRAAQLRLDAFRTRLQRLRPLLEQGLTRAAEVAELEAQIALVEADQQSARAVLRAASVRDDQAQALMQSGGVLTLRAPIAGVVTEVNARVGEHREPNAGPLVSIAQATAPQVEARFAWEPDPALGYAWIDGMRTLPLTWQGMSPTASGQDGARVAWLVAGQDAVLPAGLIGRVQTLVPEAWCAVPSGALFEDGNSHYVRVIANGTVNRHGVTLRLRGQDEALVEGLSPGARVVEVSRRDGR